MKTSVLGTVSVWKRSQYVILSDIIQQKLATSELLGERKFELGNTISHVTLQRFFENDYREKTHNDLRFLKTLDKICIFIGYKDLNSYIQKIKSEESAEEQILEEQSEFSTNLIHQYCETEFRCTQRFPHFDPTPLLQFVFEDAPLYERARRFMKEHCDKKLQLVTENNRSNYEIFDISIISDEKDQKVLKTQEFWNLLFINKTNNEEFFVNQMNTQIYFIKKINHIWKIWDNYNPNAGSLNQK